MRVALKLVAAAALSIVAAWSVSAARAIEAQRVDNSLGIEAWLVEEHSGSAVAMGIEFAGGSSQDPPGLRGLTNFLVGLMYEGAGDLDSTAYKARQKELSIQLGWEFDRDSLWGILITPSQNRVEAGHLTGLALTSPRYDSADVERVRELILMGARSRTPAQVGLLAFMAALYPTHIYGSWESGDVYTLSAMTAPDLRAYRAKILARDNLKVVIVGDVDKAGAGELLALSFAGLPAKAELVPIAQAPAPLAKRIDAKGMVTQTSIRFGGPAPKRSDRDYAAASAAAYIVGTRSAGSRLFDALVTNSGLTTAVSLTLNATDHAGWFAGNMNTQPDQANAAIATLERELKRFADEGPTPAELVRAQNYLVDAFIARFESPPSVAVELVNEVAAGLGTDFAERYVAQLLSLKADDVKRAAAKMFAPGLVIFTMAPAATPQGTPFP
jgi:zinc protease